MKLIEQKIKDYVINNDIIERGDRIVVGVSGGADSVCLLVWLNSVKKDFGLYIHAVHIHHGIRGEEADRDMCFTKELCESFGIPCEVRKYDVLAYADENAMTAEEAGRKLRYLAFEEIRAEHDCNKIAVAHHKDDSVETILFNLVRGTGAKGLRGIAPVSDMVVRPLLVLSRTEIEEYLIDHNVSWCTDSTNLEEEYSRNKIRHTVIPALKEINERAVEHILESGVIIGDLFRYVLSEANKCFFDIAKVSGNEVLLPVKELLLEEPVIRREVIRLAIETLVHTLKDITARHIYNIELLLFGQSGRFQMLPYGIMVVREQAHLKIYPEQHMSETDCVNQTQDVEIDVTQEGVYELPFGMGRFSVALLPESAEVFDENTLKNMENMYTKRMDCDKIKGALLLRTRRSGDYLTVNSGQSHKKLKEYFIEQKIPVTQRDKVLLLADGSHVLWVLGYRMSDGCKITSETTRQIEFRWIKDFTEEQ
ncbi:MAG: tRNA lysidine(34) synthetase TilS [Lachnospiraceae bacterium]|nr:tRNA lysidine(34) synthetase TilS [Lachnospiraceae bacterium]